MASFPFILCLFQTNINKILQKINAKNVHPVLGFEPTTFDIMSLVP